jgi:hypothetical protein
MRIDRLQKEGLASARLSKCEGKSYPCAAFFVIAPINVFIAPPPQAAPHTPAASSPKRADVRLM